MFLSPRGLLAVVEETLRSLFADVSDVSLFLVRLDLGRSDCLLPAVDAVMFGTSGCGIAPVSGC